MPSTANSMSTVPAFSKVSVPWTRWPCCSGCLRSMIIKWKAPDLNSTVWPDPSSMPPLTGRMRMTPSTIDIWCSSI
jgi:hypothetical protein